ncbi:DUF5000 domain-containing lipoprotein [Arachidicoccus sp.]|uniref:DUF5000 domain-containing lipoprotein n=1 Tax=Arachidicoccus sp. TaxID=1872624 RepID=UPI003D1DD36A
MKYFINLFFLLLLLNMQIGCDKKSDYIKVVSTDRTKPGPVSNVKVINGPGMATLTYTLPDSKNILYVLATYKINDTLVEQSVNSYFTDTIFAKGFAKSKDYTVTLNVVTRAKIKSDPVTVTVHPTTPPYLLSYESIHLSSTFGGAYITAKNNTGQLVGTVLLKYDSATKKMLPIDQFNGSDSIITRSVRGYPSIPYLFGACVVDQYGNSSDTVLTTLTPLPEMQLDKSLFSEFTPAYPTDAPISGGWPVAGLWDGITNQDGSASWRGLAPPSGKFPIYCTFSLGVTAKLSRYTIWQRSSFAYGNENPTNWSIWGSQKAIPADVQLPLGVPRGTVVGDWINLGNFVYLPSPSGTQPNGSATSADEAFVAAGWDYDFAPDNPPVRCIRFSSEGSFSQKVLCIVRELTFFGEPQ